MFELTNEKKEELRLLSGYEDVVFHDAREDCFRIYGLYEPYSGGRYCRIPEEVAEATSAKVTKRNYNTSGGRIRFTTDSNYVALCLTGKKLKAFSFDLYIDNAMGGRDTPLSVFVNSLRATGDWSEDIYIGRICLPEGEHSITLNLPLLRGFSELYIGLSEGATLKAGLPYRNEKPIVFYGSSITQGVGASRPGLSYPSLACRRLNAHYVNLGFAGAAKAEEAMIEHLASLDMCFFVQDYDHNAPSPEYLRATHYKLYKRVRETHPDIPILLLSRPGFNTYNAKGVLRTNASIERRNVVIDTFRAARAEGDMRVWYIDGESFFSGPDECECTLDGIHPNDIGMLKMADRTHHVMLRILNEVPFLEE